MASHGPNHYNTTLHHKHASLCVRKPCTYNNNTGLPRPLHVYYNTRLSGCLHRLSYLRVLNAFTKIIQYDFLLLRFTMRIMHSQTAGRVPAPNATCRIVWIRHNNYYIKWEIRISHYTRRDRKWVSHVTAMITPSAVTRYHRGYTNAYSKVVSHQRI